MIVLAVLFLEVVVCLVLVVCVSMDLDSQMKLVLSTELGELSVSICSSFVTVLTIMPCFNIIQVLAN